MTVLRLVGYWRSDFAPEWPDVERFVDAEWDETERHLVARYLTGGTCARAYRGFSPCRLCGEHNGSAEFTDGTWLWPQGLAHYVREHGVRLPPEFEAFAIRRLKDLESSEVDHAWWIQQQGP